MTSSDLSVILPRVLIVSRRSLRKNKFVDFVGEYHLDLIVGYGAVPVIVPRVSGVHTLLDSFEPIHGVLLCEGEDIDPSLYGDAPALSPEEMEEIRRLHISDTAIDREKDSIELRLAKLCLDRHVPYLGICRGSQVLNVACGGTLYQDLETELSRSPSGRGGEKTVHIDYENYDGHRHAVRVVDHTPLGAWFRDSLHDGRREIRVNSYHHQGVRRLARRFVPMAFAPDGLVEAFYDPDAYDPGEGKFMMGLQFHPERMRLPDSDQFDYPGCPSAYQEFVKAVIAYQKKRMIGGARVPAPMKLDKETERKRRSIHLSFTLARDIYAARSPVHRSKQSQLDAGAEFLASNMVLSAEQENRLMEMGATVRNASWYSQRMEGRRVLQKMTVEQLSDLMAFHDMMGEMCLEALETKLRDVVDMKFMS